MHKGYVIVIMIQILLMGTSSTSIPDIKLNTEKWSCISTFPVVFFLMTTITICTQKFSNTLKSPEPLNQVQRKILSACSLCLYGELISCDTPVRNAIALRCLHRTSQRSYDFSPPLRAALTTHALY